MKSTVVTSPCPDAEVLTQYVSGVLESKAAESLANHLERCRTCQGRVDGLTHRKDSLLEAVRRSSDAVSVSGQSNLAVLLEKAQRLRGTQASPDKRAPVRAVSLDVFVSCLRKSGLMNPSEVDLFLEGNHHTDSTGLARELITRNKLTRFQARALLRGFWKGFFLGNYIILEKLAQGGMSTVFKARHRRLGRVVCLKVPHTSRESPGIAERFRREAKTVAALNLPNIVVAHDADQDGQVPFLVMEFVEGRDLAKLVADQGALPAPMVISMMLQVARALDYMHREGVVHRDIKPHNLLVDESGAVKILDMGLARFDSYLTRNADATTHASITASGVIMGTIDYMAPEQAINCRLADHRSDIYSLGCTLFFLLMGKPVFSGETLMEKLVAHREQPAPTLTAANKDIPAELNAIFQHMVEKEPSRRYQSMADLVRDLEITQTGRAKTLKCLAASRRKKRLLTFTQAAVIIALAVVGLGIWQGPKWFAPVEGRVPKEKTPKPKLPVSNPPPAIVGHPKTLVNRGPGRALIVVPHGWFYEDQFQAIDKAMKKMGIDLVVASSKPGAANPKHGKIKPVPVDLMLDQFKSVDFDAVVFLGGNYYEFTHKNPGTGNLAKQIIETCLDQGLIVASIGDAGNILSDAGITQNCNYQKNGHLVVGSLKGHTGRVINLAESKYAPEFVEAVFGDDGLRKAVLPK